MMTKFGLILLLLWMAPILAQPKIHTFEQAGVLVKTHPKPLVVFVHTDWCKYCRMMEQTTFKNPELTALLNERFYFIALDAETTQPIAFNQRTFKFVPTGNGSGTHELATELAANGGEVSYPTVVILDSDFTILGQKASFLTAAELISILQKINPE